MMDNVAYLERRAREIPIDRCRDAFLGRIPEIAGHLPDGLSVPERRRFADLALVGFMLGWAYEGIRKRAKV